MFKKNYYCIISGLPELIRESRKKTKYTSAKFSEEMKELLAEEDYNILKLLYLDIDNKNLIQLLQKKETEENTSIGNYTIEELKEQIKEPTYIVDYLKEFIIQHKEEAKKQSEQQQELLLQTLYFEYMQKQNNEFVKKWFNFELNIKNLLSAINCHKYGYPPETQLIKIPNNEIYYQLIKQTPKAENLKHEIPFAEDIIKIAEKEGIKNKEIEIDKIKWNFIDENTFFHYFTIEKIAAFAIKLKISERWLKMEKEKGEKLLRKLIGNITAEIKN